MLHLVGNISKGIYLRSMDPWTLNIIELLQDRNFTYFWALSAVFITSWLCSVQQNVTNCEVILCSFFFVYLSWSWRHQIFLKHWYLPTRLKGMASQRSTVSPHILFCFMSVCDTWPLLYLRIDICHFLILIWHACPVDINHGRWMPSASSIHWATLTQRHSVTYHKNWIPNSFTVQTAHCRYYRNTRAE